MSCNISPVFNIPETFEDVAVFVDFLELSSIIAEDFCVSLLDLIEQVDFESDYNEEEIDAIESEKEEVISKLCDEIRKRKDVLEDAYPFDISSDGITFFIISEAEWNIGCKTYLFSLFLSHLSKSLIVSIPYREQPKKLIELSRWLFQKCACLAAAGKMCGPSFILYPRKNGFLEKLKEIYLVLGDGKPRSEALSGSPISVNDDGVDIIAWEYLPDNRPGGPYLLGQVASGNDWRDKSLVQTIKRFHEEWFEVIPASFPIPAIFIPYYISRDEMRRHSRSLGVILDRLRLPINVLFGESFRKQKGFHVDEVEDLDVDLSKWLINYRVFLQERAVAI